MFSCYFFLVVFFVGFLAVSFLVVAFGFFSSVFAFFGVSAFSVASFSAFGSSTSSFFCGVLFCSWVSASKVACAMFIAFLDPCAFDKTFFTPDNSKIFLTAPPAITPVPSGAGKSKIFVALNFPMTSCGIESSKTGTENRFLLALLTPFCTPPITSAALPIPNPTRPFLSPITMETRNRILRPPFTTLVTLSI